MCQLTPTLVSMDQFDTLLIQCVLIDLMHEGVWFRKICFDKMTATCIRT